MNMEIKARDLVAAGWHEGRRLGPALRRARDLESTGLERAAVLAQLAGEIEPLGCIMAGEAPEPPWVRARREKQARHRAERREGREQTAEG